MRTADVINYQANQKVREVSILSTNKGNPLIGTPLKCFREGNTYIYTLNNTSPPKHGTTYSNTSNTKQQSKRRSIIYGSILEEKYKGRVVHT